MKRLGLSKAKPRPKDSKEAQGTLKIHRMTYRSTEVFDRQGKAGIVLRSRFRDGA